METIGADPASQRVFARVLLPRKALNTYGLREIYPGKRPFSEPESSAVAKFMNDHLNELKAYVSLHAFENAVLVPFGYSVRAKPENFEELFDVARQITDDMNRVHGNNITAIKSSSLC